MSSSKLISFEKIHDGKTHELILGRVLVCSLHASLHNSGSKAVLSQQVGLPHVLPSRKPLRDLDLVEVLNAFLQLLLNRWLFFYRPLLAATGVSRAGCKSAQQVTLSSLVRLLNHANGAFLRWPVEGLDLGMRVRLTADWTSDDCSLGRAGLRLALRAGG